MFFPEKVFKSAWFMQVPVVTPYNCNTEITIILGLKKRTYVQSGWEEAHHLSLSPAYSTLKNDVSISRGWQAVCLFLRPWYKLPLLPDCWVSYREKTFITEVLTSSNLLKGHFYIASTAICGVLAYWQLLCFYFKNDPNQPCYYLKMSQNLERCLESSSFQKSCPPK